MIKSTSQQGTYQKCYRQIRIIILILYWQIRKHISALLTHFLLYKKGRNVNWLGHTRRNYFLEHVIEGNVEGRIELTGRRRERRKQLQDDLNPLTPNDDYSGCTTPLTSKSCILYIYKQI